MPSTTRSRLLPYASTSRARERRSRVELIAHVDNTGSRSGYLSVTLTRPALATPVGCVRSAIHLASTPSSSSGLKNRAVASSARFFLNAEHTAASLSRKSCSVPWSSGERLRPEASKDIRREPTKCDQYSESSAHSFVLEKAWTLRYTSVRVRPRALSVANAVPAASATLRRSGSVLQC
eukprot:scaffold143623_cov30-Tisochrysis_lutea.AAC.2